MGRPWTGAEVRRLEALVHARPWCSTTVIAAAVGRTGSAVRFAIQRHSSDTLDKLRASGKLVLFRVALEDEKAGARTRSQILADLGIKRTALLAGYAKIRGCGDIARRRFSAAEAFDLLNAYDRGITMSQLGQIYGAPYTTVRVTINRERNRRAEASTRRLAKQKRAS